MQSLNMAKYTGTCVLAIDSSSTKHKLKLKPRSLVTDFTFERPHLRNSQTSRAFGWYVSLTFETEVEAWRLVLFLSMIRWKSLFGRVNAASLCPSWWKGLWKTGTAYKQLRALDQPGAGCLGSLCGPDQRSLLSPRVRWWCGSFDVVPLNVHVDLISPNCWICPQMKPTSQVGTLSFREIAESGLKVCFRFLILCSNFRYFGPAMQRWCRTLESDSNPGPACVPYEVR